jgi:hypothetical protein
MNLIGVGSQRHPVRRVVVVLKEILATAVGTALVPFVDHAFLSSRRMATPGGGALARWRPSEGRGSSGSWVLACMTRASIAA